MDAPIHFNDQLLFHITGKRPEPAALDLCPSTLRPALLAAYRRLDQLRHDYPLVLLDRPGADGYALPLSTVISRMAADLAPRGLEGERVRRYMLRLEREVRAMVAEGATGLLSEMWPQALARMPEADDPVARGVLVDATEEPLMDGELVPCDEALPARALTQAWRHAQLQKSADYHRVADALMRKLSDILRAVWAHSQAGQQPEALRAAVGGSHADIFDFSRMSSLVARRTPKDELTPARRSRIEWALGVLSRQDFWPDVRAEDPLPQGFEFSDCASAMAAFRQRLPKAVELLKAIAVAELETAGRYLESEHDPLFERFDVNSLDGEDFALLPDSLVLIPPGRNDAPENAGLLEMLSSGMPAKVLVQVSDLMEESAFGTGHFAFGVRSARLATTAMGLGGMFVLQCASSALHTLKGRVARGMSVRSPALFAVFSGSPEPSAGLPRYLTAAAATKSRAFPAFTYDALAGDNWAARFSLEGNHCAEDDWPVETLEYADEALQRAVQTVGFTYADFALTDRRNAAHFQPVPRERWHDGQVPVAEWLALADPEASGKVPYVLAVDADDRLYRVIVDARLMKATRACLALWHRLQEHAGIHDSHAERLLAEERARVAAQAAQAAQAAPAAAAPAAAAVEAAPAPAAAPAAEEPAPAAPPSDEAWIETSRCPSCNECQQINPRMFAYNENKQAYVRDVKAGSYRELVEAAEACQVAIIHPGKPRDPNEPGLEELLERAKPFL